MRGVSLPCRKPHALFVRSLSKKHVYPLCIRAIQGHSGDRLQPNFFSKQLLELGDAKELYQIGLAKYDTHNEGWYKAASKVTGDDKQSASLCKNSDTKYMAYTHLKRSSLWTWTARRRTTSSSSKPSTAASSASTRSRSASKSHPHL